MKNNLVTSVVLILFSVGCKPQQYTIDDLPDNHIVFGKGGGMTGSEDTYILLVKLELVNPLL